MKPFDPDACEQSSNHFGCIEAENRAWNYNGAASASSKAYSMQIKSTRSATVFHKELN